MKPRSFILLTFVALSAHQASSATRTLAEARTVAQKFMIEKTGHRISETALQLSNPTRADKSVQPYYIFNDTESSRFVIVSGSDLMREVIGYSTTACIPENQELPDNLRSWLQWVAESGEYLESHPDAALTGAELQFSTSAIEPLMGSTWDQSPLYNKFCPTTSATSTKLCPTGCVATAAAQVVRYHLAKSGKIITGIGEKSYIHNGRSLSVNYANNTYDYTKMPLSLSSTSKDEEIDEVAKLCYHIGVGIHMNYASSGSGAFTEALPTTLIDNFGFNSNYRHADRILYDFDEWNQLLINELQNGRPIIYSGSSSTGGHCFVLEGVDSNGLYYVNWGWGGKSDGYFDVNILRPSSVGTGASLSPDGYISFCSASVNLCLEEGVGEKLCPLFLYDVEMTLAETDLSCGDALNIKKIAFYNHSPYIVSGELGYALFSKTGVVDTKEITSIENLEGIDLNEGTYGGVAYSFYYQIPADLADGDYDLHFTFKSAEDEELYIIRGYYPSLSYISLKVKDGKVTASIPHYKTELNASDWKVESENIFAETSTPISVMVTNNSAQTFVGKFFLTIISSIGVQANTFESGEVPVIAPGESAKVSFNVTFPSAATWTVKLTTKRQGVGDVDYEDVTYGTSTVTAAPNPSQDANLILTENLQVLADGPIDTATKFKVKLNIENKGGDYTGEAGLQFFASVLMRDVRAEAYAPVSIAANQNDEIVLELAMPELKEGASYYVRAVYSKGSKYEPFQVNDGVSNRATIKAGATSIDRIFDNDAIENSKTKAYDISGKEVNVSLDGKPLKGTYVINGQVVIIK